jgi:hypothetical protein
MDDIVGQFKLFRTFFSILFYPAAFSKKLIVNRNVGIEESLKHYFAGLAFAVAVAYINVELHPNLAIKPKPIYFIVQIAMHLIVFLTVMLLIYVAEGKLLIQRLFFVYLFLWSSTMVVGALVHFFKLYFVTVSHDVSLILFEDVLRRLILLRSYIVVFDRVLGVSVFTTLLLQFVGVLGVFFIMPLIQTALAS